MYYSYILIGPALNSDYKTISGQSMMFQLFVNYLIKLNLPLKIIDISEKSEKSANRQSGNFNRHRIFEYFKLFFNYIVILFFKKNNTIVYLTVSQSLIGFYRDLFFIYFGKLFNCKIIAHQFGGNFGSFYNRNNLFIKYLIRLIYGKITWIIVEGEYSKENFVFLPNYHKKVISLPNGLPEAKIGKSPIRIFKHGETFNVLYLSNMILSKGYLDLLHAINIVINKRKLNVHCSFVGKFLNSVDDPENYDIEVSKQMFFQYIKDNHLEKFVSYSESKLGNEKQIEFQNSHLFVLPSYYINEGQPVSVLEAISYGVVPLITNYRLMPQMIKDNSGLFVKTKDPISIADSIEYFYNNPDVYRYFSESSINHFENNFTSDIYLKKLFNIIQS
jgi:glycosyltransferase involved in cell wall biosynthesis